MSRSSAARSHSSIGEVLAILRPEFPDITISKIRFLESEGLITPDRTPSGYRKFSREDIARLGYVLAAQRDRYLPLRVIKEQLEAMDQGVPAEELPGGPVRAPRTLMAAPEAISGEDFAAEPSPVRLSRDQLCAAADITADELGELEQYGLLPARAGHYDSTAVTIAQTVRDLRRFGIEPRHLRAFRTAADREIGLFSQVVTPLVRQRSPEAHGRAEESVRELAALSVRLHAALMKAGLRSVLGG